MPSGPVSPQDEPESGQIDPDREKESAQPPVLSRQAQAKPGADRAMDSMPRRSVAGPSMDTASKEEELERGGETGQAPVSDKAAFELTEEGLVQGVVWAEVLSRPRALRPFRGPRT